MKIEREILEKTIKMEDYLENLLKIFPKDKNEFVNNLEKMYACYFLFIQMVEELSDIISLLAIKFFMLSDDFYTDLERISKKVNFLNDMSNDLKRIRKIRNLIVHHYYEKIDDRKLYDEIKRSLGIFETFIKNVRKWISKNI